MKTLKVEAQIPDPIPIRSNPDVEAGGCNPSCRFLNHLPVNVEDGEPAITGTCKLFQMLLMRSSDKLNGEWLLQRVKACVEAVK